MRRSASPNSGGPSRESSSTGARMSTLSSGPTRSSRRWQTWRAPALPGPGASTSPIPPRSGSRQGQGVEGFRAGRPHARGAVGQLLDPAGHAAGEPLAAGPAQAAGGGRLARRDHDPALAMPVEVILALLGKKLHGAQEALAPVAQ